MLFHSDPLFSIFWGDKQESFPPRYFATLSDSKELADYPSFTLAYKLMTLEHLIVLKQTHSAQGHIITSPKQLASFQPYKYEGDYLITNLSHVGLGISSADCLPLIMHDTASNTIGIAHVGWAGATQEIALKMLDNLRYYFDTSIEHLKIFLGPSARSCCYEIQNDVATKLTKFPYSAQAIQRRNDKLYLDVPLFNILQLTHVGIQADAFNMHYNACTVCNDSFCSYRREGAHAKRQITITALKST